jgi:stage II sporulation protein P
MYSGRRFLRILRYLAVIAALCLAVRGASSIWPRASAALQDAAGQDGFMTSVIDAELGGRNQLQSFLQGFLAMDDKAEAEGEDEDFTLYIYEPPEVELAEKSDDGEAAEVTVTSTDSADYSSDGIYIKNYTEYQVDIDKLLGEELNISLDGDPQVLIVHTHGSEAYTASGSDTHTESDPGRTEDTEYNVVRVGDELEKALTERGISVIHDRELYDYPSYNGAYGRTCTAVQEYLAEYPSIKIVIDLHRDALVGDDGTVYKTVAELSDYDSAQVMLVVGTDFYGLEHPQWRENFKLALRLQSAMNAKYPTLARPICLSQYRYNQHLSTGALIVEVGCSGNTLSEAITAVTLFADAAAEVILGLG